MRERPGYSEWESVMVCQHCTEEISHYDYHNNDAVCVHCGKRGRHDILPDVTKKSRRKRYTGLRRDAIEAQKVRNSSIFVRPFLYLGERARRMRARPFIWEYKDVKE